MREPAMLLAGGRLQPFARAVGGLLGLEDVLRNHGAALRPLHSGQGHGKAHHCGCGIRLSGQGITAAHSFPAYPLERGQGP
eukprot:COSAG03_NODE_43_length_17034_cov_9.679953_12_plen_81_part_00